MSDQILHVLTVRVAGDHELELEFSDGVTKVVDLEHLLTGQMFEPMRDPKYFARVSIDPVSGTVVWPNGADLAPEALYDLSVA